MPTLTVEDDPFLKNQLAQLATAFSGGNKAAYAKAAEEIAKSREERAREATEDEIMASARKAKREAQAAADESAPDWLRNKEKVAATSGYRTF